MVSCPLWLPSGVLLIVDYATRYPEILPLSKANSQNIAHPKDILKEQITFCFLANGGGGGGGLFKQCISVYNSKPSF